VNSGSVTRRGTAALSLVARRKCLESRQLPQSSPSNLSQADRHTGIAYDDLAGVII
jgi:hypothetical protein